MRTTATTISALLGLISAGAGMALADIGADTGAGASPIVTSRTTAPAPTRPSLIFAQSQKESPIERERKANLAHLFAVCTAQCSDEEQKCIRSKNAKTKRSASEAFYQCQPQLKACFAHCDQFQ